MWTHKWGQVTRLHGSTFNRDSSHCHPHITPDGKKVLYTSDTTGYANIYLVEIGDVEDLKELRIDDGKSETEN